MSTESTVRSKFHIVSEPGNFRARFSMHSFDYIDLELESDGQTAWGRRSACIFCDEERAREHNLFSTPGVKRTVDFSSYECAFADFIRFLEAVTTGVQKCEFSWDAEGPYRTMSWRTYRAGEGLLSISDKAWLWEIPIGSIDLVRELYGAFRTFVDGSRYDPLRYERLRCFDAYQLVLSDRSLGELAREIARLSRADAANVLQLLNDVAQSRTTGESLQFPLEWYLDEANHPDGQWLAPPKDWDKWPFRKRLRHLGKDWARSAFGSWYGSNLRQLRSKLIEGWLGEARCTSPLIAARC